MNNGLERSQLWTKRRLNQIHARTNIDIPLQESFSLKYSFSTHHLQQPHSAFRAADSVPNFRPYPQTDNSLPTG